MTANLRLSPRVQRLVSPTISVIDVDSLSDMDGGWTRGHVTGDFDAMRSFVPDDIAWLASGFVSDRPRSTSYLDLPPVLIATMQEIEPGAGYPMHPHRGIDTITVMLSGSYLHEDTLGGCELIGPDAVTVVSSGRGFEHQETAQPGDKLRSVMFWVRSNTPDAAPRVATRTIPRHERTDRLVGIGLDVSADLEIVTGVLTRGADVVHDLTRRGYLISTAGAIDVNGVRAEAGERVLIGGPGRIAIRAVDATEIVLLSA